MSVACCGGTVQCWCWVGCFRSEERNSNCHVINSIERFNVVLPEKTLSNDFLRMCDLSITHHNRKYSICEHASANSTVCVLDHVPVSDFTLTMKGSFPNSRLMFMFARIFPIPSPRSVLPKLFPSAIQKWNLMLGHGPRGNHRRIGLFRCKTVIRIRIKRCGFFKAVTDY